MRFGAIANSARGGLKFSKKVKANHFKILVCLHWDSCDVGEIFRSCVTFRKTYTFLWIIVMCYPDIFSPDNWGCILLHLLTWTPLSGEKNIVGK